MMKKAQQIEVVIKKSMCLNIADCVDRATGEVNYTRLAETAANDCDCHDRLDDETDPIWDWAIEIGDEIT